MNYKVTLSYDGSNFHGWAKQTNFRTVQSEIENALKHLFKKNININVAGRTDAKVHAFRQVFSFKSNKTIPINNLSKALNKCLPWDIHIHNIKIVADNFHARYSAKAKIYKYFITNKLPSVFMRNYIYYCPKKINSSLLKSATKLFVGKHDFLSFTISTLANTTRKIDYIKINKAKSQTIITIKGQGFLRAMIRMLIGSLLDLNSHTKTLKDIEYLLNNPKKGSSISKVDGCGLYLYQVCY